jgi:hypothetical protein
MYFEHFLYDPTLYDAIYLFLVKSSTSVTVLIASVTAASASLDSRALTSTSYLISFLLSIRADTLPLYSIRVASPFVILASISWIFYT